MKPGRDRLKKRKIVEKQVSLHIVGIVAGGGDCLWDIDSAGECE